MFSYEEVRDQRKLAGFVEATGLSFPKVKSGTLEDLRDEVGKLAAQKLGAKYCYVVATFSNRAVVSVDQTDGKTEYYEIPLAVKNGVLELGDPVAVERQVTFRKVEALCRRTRFLYEGKVDIGPLLASKRSKMQVLAGVGPGLGQQIVVENRRGLPELKDVHRAKMVLLEDEKVEEGKVVRPMKIGGVVSRGNVVNENGRYYPTKLWKRECERKQEAMKSGRLIGELDHPDDGKSRLNRTSVRYTNLEMDGDLMKFEAEALETASGQTLKALLRGGVGVDISTRGFGTTKKETVDGREVETIQDDFELVAIDQVAGRSNLSAEIQYYQE